MLSRIKTIYFPFSPGIAWKIKRGKYILPMLDKHNWDKALDNRNVAVIAYGGLFESFFSLCILEAIHSLYPDKKLFWHGNDRFAKLAYLNGLVSTMNKPQIDESFVNKYPIPIFLDKESCAYFNCLNNYIDIYRISGEFGYRNKKALTKQIFENSCLNWANNIPKFRNLTEPFEFQKFHISKKFDFNKPFVFVCPDKTGWSEHDESFLRWHLQQVRSFISMLQSIGINTVVMTPNVGLYTGIRALILEPNLDHLLWIIPKAKAVLSEELDILLIALTISDAKVFCIKHKHEYSISKNGKFINKSNNVFMFKNLTPIDAFQGLK